MHQAASYVISLRDLPTFQDRMEKFIKQVDEAARIMGLKIPDGFAYPGGNALQRMATEARMEGLEGENVEEALQLLCIAFAVTFFGARLAADTVEFGAKALAL